MAQSSVGKIRIFDDFIGFEVPVASTAAPATEPYFTPGGLRVVGQGLAENDSGVVGLDSDALNGVVRVTTTDEPQHSAGFTTNTCFDMTLNGGISIEARVRFADLNGKEAYFGLTDVVTDGVGILEGEQMTAAGTTLAPDASDLCGFYLSAELTDDEDWHGVYNGGTTTGATTSTDVDLDDDAVAGEFQVLRLEVDSNGTARWYIDGDLKQTVTGAVSTSTDLAALLMVEEKGTATSTMDVDYVLIETNRDWTV
jgi:hypothetical protein